MSGPKSGQSVTLPPGSRLGPYEIVSLLGAGGMGEVYRARDTRLAREVALKILPASYREDSGRFRRFQTEAKAAAALSHPNIVAVYDVGQEAGTQYIVSELVPGGTLKALLERGSLPVKRLLDLAIPMAEALAAAHASGIVHRDLKPDNVLIASDGRPRIADFGLAKYYAPVPSEGSVGTTLPEDRTREGIVVGTVGYMSPEQAEGKDVDYRSDQFSFGSVLYEMATGRRAFQGKGVIDTLAAIVNEEPEPIDKVNPKIPGPLRWIIQRCHAKEPSRRYDSTGDLARELASVREHMAEMSGAAAASGVVARRRPLIAALMVAAALAVPAGMFLAGRSTANRPLPTFQQLTFRRGLISNARFGPDGNAVVFSASFDGGPQRIYTLHPGSPESSALNLPELSLLAVSRSGELAVSFKDNLGFGGTLARVPFSGGSPRSILTTVHEADWAPDGERLAVAHEVGGRIRLEFPIGRSVYESTAYVGSPRVDPRGDRVAFADHPIVGEDVGSIMVADASGAARAISKDWYELATLAWSPDSSEIWFSASKTGLRRSLWAVTLSGRLRLLAETPGSSMIQDVSPGGHVLVNHETGRGFMSAMLPGETMARDLTWFDFSHPTDLSDDGTTLLFQEWGEAGGNRGAVYLRRLDESPPVRLGEGFGLRLSPDGQWVLSRLYTTPPRLVLLPTGAGETRSLSVEGNWVESAFWFPGGKRLLLVGGAAGKTRYSVLDLETGKTRALASASTTPVYSGAISPDGRLFARWGDRPTLDLLSLETGEALPARGAEPNEYPIRWSPDGRILYVYRREDMFNVITRVDPFTGKREPWKRLLISADSVGLIAGFLDRVLLSADGQTCVWSYARVAGELYLVEGLR